MTAAAVLVPTLLGVAVAAAFVPSRGERPRLPGRAGRHPGPRRPPLTERVGAGASRLLRLPHDPVSDRSLGRALLVGLAVAPILPPAAVVVPAAAAARAALRRRRAQAAERRTILRSLPDAVDLLLLGTTAGMGLALAHTEVARRLPGPVGAALGRARDQADRGQPRADALVAALAPLGERAAALGHVLADHLRYGTPLAPELERLGLELRLDRRRAAEEDARKVPVRLLAPLVACTLPAFALLTVAPLLIASLRHLPT